jgi:hypothetical protein
MFKNTATTVTEYLAALPPERRSVIAAMREFMRKHIPHGYEEGIHWGAITWCVPLAQYPNTYNGQPLCYAALAAQKNYFALYPMTVYGDSSLAAGFKAAFKKAGKKLDMGKSCVRFKSTEDLALDAVRDALTVASPAQWIAHYEAVRGERPARKTKPKRNPRKTVRRKAVARRVL